MGEVGGVFAWVAYYYHFYCYNLNTILKKKMLNLYKMKKRSKCSDMNSDL